MSEIRAARDAFKSDWTKQLPAAEAQHRPDAASSETANRPGQADEAAGLAGSIETIRRALEAAGLCRQSEVERGEPTTTTQVDATCSRGCDRSRWPSHHLVAATGTPRSPDPVALRTCRQRRTCRDAEATR
jgi:hypothetical protein